MLLNMVKIRYGDAPVFLDVTSVINQYATETEVHGSLAWDAFLPTDSQNVGASHKYADRPTISYQPLQGDKFTRGLMTPIPPHSILALMEAGWRADFLFRLCVQSILFCLHLVHRCDLDRAGFQVFDRMIGAVMAVIHFQGFTAQGQS